MKKFIERIYDNMYIAMEERKPIKVQNSKLSTTNHIIELLVNLDQNPNTKSSCGYGGDYYESLY